MLSLANELPRVTEEVYNVDEAADVTEQVYSDVEEAYEVDEEAYEYVENGDRQVQDGQEQKSEEGTGPKFWNLTRIVLVIMSVILVIVLIVVATSIRRKESPPQSGEESNDVKKTGKDKANTSTIVGKMMSESSNSSTSDDEEVLSKDLGYRLTQSRWGAYKGHHLRLQALGTSKTFHNFLEDKVYQKTINGSDDYPVLRSFFGYVKKLSPYVDTKAKGEVDPKPFEKVLRAAFKNDPSKESQKTYEYMMEPSSKSAENHLGRWGLDGIIVTALLKEAKQLGWKDLVTAMETLNSNGVYANKYTNDEFVFGTVRNAERIPKYKKKNKNWQAPTIDAHSKLIEVKGGSFTKYTKKGDPSKSEYVNYTVDGLPDKIVVSKGIFHSKLPITEEARTYKLSSIVFHRQSGGIGHCMVLARTKGTSRDAPNAWVALNHEDREVKFMSDVEAEKFREEKKWNLYSYLLEKA